MYLSKINTKQFQFSHKTQVLFIYLCPIHNAMTQFWLQNIVARVLICFICYKFLTYQQVFPVTSYEFLKTTISTQNTSNCVLYHLSSWAWHEIWFLNKAKDGFIFGLSCEDKNSILIIVKRKQEILKQC